MELESRFICIWKRGKGGGSLVIKVLVFERFLIVRVINLVWGCSVGM